jgi:Peptidase family M48
MARNTIAAVIACLYVAASAWLVSATGQAHRNSLRQAGLSASSVTETPVGPLESRSERSRVEEIPVLPPPPVVVKKDPPSLAHRVVSTPPAMAPAPSVAAPDPAPEPRPTRAPGKSAAPGSAAAATSSAATVRLDPIWQSPMVKRKWDLSHLSAQDEMRLGAELNNLIMHFNRQVQGGSWLERVETAARPILANRPRKDIDYKFTILDSDAVNAFSHPGGYIYISRGLFPFLGEDEDAALQFALAHEIAHVDLRHAMQCLLDPDLQSMEKGTLQQIYGLILPVGYMDKQEYAADRWAYQQLIRLDRTRYEALKFLRKLKGYAEVHEFNDGRAPYQPGPRSSPVDNHYRGHTAVWRRLNELEAATSPASTKPK